MIDVERNIGIRASRDVVWRVVTDFPRMPEWFVGLRRVELLSGRLEAGAERRITLIHGARHRERIEPFEPGKRFGVVVGDPPFFAESFTAQIALEGEESGVRLRWGMAWKPRAGVVGRLFGTSLVRPLLGAVLDRSLQRLRDRVERLQ